MRYLFRTILFCASLVFVICDPVIVTVQNMDQASMDQLTQKIDAEVSLGSASASRVTLGAIEATMSRVVDADATYTVTHPPTIPTLALLDDIAFDSVTNAWTLRYSTMPSDPADEVNAYKRVLYASKQGNAEAGDVTNPCLALGVDVATCMSDLKAGYVVADAADGTQDTISLDTTDLAASPVSVLLQGNPTSAVETLSITVPHAAIRNVLGKKSVAYHPVDGNRTTWTFGIGMLFVGTSSNIILHDTFTLVEVSNQLITVSKSNSYSIARQVTFFTQQVVNHPDIYVAKLEISLNPGHVLESLEVTINENDISAECAPMQALITALDDDGACLTPHPVCEPVSYTSNTNGQQESWVTMVVPVNGVLLGQEVRISTLITTIDTSVTPNKRVLSSLNFATRSPPQMACSPEAYSSFTPIDHTTAELYRGVGVVPETFSGYISVHNSGEETAGTIDSLLTIVIRPKDASALAYFQSFPDEEIRLDDVYMSHALPDATLPESIDNTVHTISGGRSRLLVDSGLIQACPEEAAAGFDYTGAGFTCVTTHDWGLSGGILRPKSKSLPDGPYFVWNPGAHTEAENKAWLQSNVIGQESENADAVADSIIAASWAHVTAAGAEYQPHARVYWIWPVYYWPDQSPIGLKDHTVVSLSWSLSQASAAPPPARRLLSLPSAPGPIFSVLGSAKFTRKARTRPLSHKKFEKSLAFYGDSVKKMPVKRLQRRHLNRIEEAVLPVVGK